MTTTAVDPLERIRDQLVGAAARANRRRRRRRLTLGFAVLPLVLVSASAGAAALGGFSTGVPAIDRLLATEGGPAEGTDPRPGAADASEPLALPNAADGTGAAEVAYLSRDGRICKVQGDFRRSDDAPRGGGGGCYEPADLARMLSARKAICCGSSNGPDRRIYDGYAAGDVVALRFHTDDGASFDATLTEPWRPDAPGAEPLRIFVAVDERDIDVGLLHQRYRVEATLQSGRTVSIRTPWGR